MDRYVVVVGSVVNIHHNIDEVRDAQFVEKAAVIFVIK
jgi:hypothetical protein